MALIDNEAEADEPSTAGQSDDEILSEARKRYQLCIDAEGANKEAALADLLFLSGGDAQWDPLGLDARRRAGRPVITVNVLPTYLHQVTNDQRQNTPSIKVHPVGDKADVETAKVRQGMIRHIEYDSNADVAYDTAVNSAAAVGFGYFRLITDYVSEDSFNQKIMFQRIRNALSVKIDPLNVEADGSGMQYAFVECAYSRSEFKTEWPDANANDTSLFSSSTIYTGWLSDLTVMVCDYYRIEKEPVEVVLLSNGESGFKDKLVELPPGVTIAKTRKGERSKVIMYKITGCDILDRTEIKCKWIPVFPVYGDEIDIEGKILRSGVIRHAKGPCQSYNVFISGATEEMAMRSKSPYIGAEGQFEGHEDEWSDPNSTFPFREYKPTSLDGKLTPRPERQPMADIPTGMLAMAMHSRDNIKATTGLFDSSIGAKGTATSGVQEREQQQQGDMANFHYQDGLIRTLRHAGRCVDCMIPHYYDWQGVVQIMREDGTLDHAQINTPQQGADEQGNPIQTVLNDMTCGEYAVTISAGPSYSTMREESSEFFTKAMQAAKDPATASIVTYLAMKNQDAPGAEVATKMLASMLPPAAAAVLEKENGGDDPPPMVPTPQGPIPVPQAAQMLGELQQKLQQCEEALKQADAAKQQAEAMKQQAILNEQQLEPQKQATEQRRIEADIAKANAAIEQARAATLQAQADMVRAQAEAAAMPQRALTDHSKAEADRVRATAEAATAPVRAQTELVNAHAAAKQALMPEEGEEPEEPGEPKEPLKMPTSMKIKTPGGFNYEVELH